VLDSTTSLVSYLILEAGETSATNSSTEAIMLQVPRPR